jgi:hypothetical protein
VTTSVVFTTVVNFFSVIAVPGLVLPLFLSSRIVPRTYQILVPYRLVEDVMPRDEDPDFDDKVYERSSIFRPSTSPFATS